MSHTSVDDIYHKYRVQLESSAVDDYKVFEHLLDDRDSAQEISKQALINRNPVLVKHLLDKGKFVSPTEDSYIWHMRDLVNTALREQENAALLVQHKIIPANMTLVIATRDYKPKVVRAAMQAGAVAWDLAEEYDCNHCIYRYGKELALARPTVDKAEQVFMTVLEEFPELTREEIAQHVKDPNVLDGYHDAIEELHYLAEQRRHVALKAKLHPARGLF